MTQKGRVTGSNHWPGGSRLSDFMESGTSHGPGNARLADVMEAGTSLIETLLIYFYMINLRSP